MARRSTPERLDVARRDALRIRLTGTGMIETTADGWIAAWEAQTAGDGLEGGAAYWQAAWAWIDTQRRRRVRP